MNAWHTKIATLTLVLTLFGCDRGSDDTHDGTNRPVKTITHFTDRTELFVEFPALVVGEASPFAAHLTRLDDFKPVAAGQVTVVLTGNGLPEERFEATDPLVSGIFRPVARPQHEGERSLVIVIESDGRADRHEVGRVTVYPSLTAVKSSEDDEAPAGITFLKEQQWRTEFATTSAHEQAFRASTVANGAIRARPDGEVWISAPVSGRIVNVGAGFPRIGLTVERDQELAVIAPRVAGNADLSSLELALARAELHHGRAHREHERVERLARQAAVPGRRLQEARDEEEAAHAEVAAAERQLAQYHGTQHTDGGDAPGRMTVRAPIAGTVVEVSITPGAFIEEGRPMFHVVDLERLWLEVQIPAAEIERVRDARGAWFEVEGFAQPFEVSEDAGGRFVALGGVIDPDRRTVPLIFELPNLERKLHIGMFARVRVLSGASRRSVAVPGSAVSDEHDAAVVYVQLGGEAFERRVVRLGWRDGDWVEVLDGLAVNERVVARGAYQIRLAASVTTLPAHGHAH